MQSLSITLRSIGRIFGILKKAHPKAFVFSIVLLLLIPVPGYLNVVYLNKLITSLSAIEIEKSKQYSLILIATFLLANIISFFRSRNNSQLLVLGYHEFEKSNVELLQKHSLQTIEQPEFKKLHTQLMREGNTFRLVVRGLQTLTGSILRLFGWGSIFALTPWPVLVMTLFGILGYAFVTKRVYTTETEIQHLRNDSMLRMSYYYSKLAQLNIQASIRTNQLSKPFEQRHTDTSLSIRNDIIQKRFKTIRLETFADLVVPISIALGLFILIPQLENQTITAAIIITFITAYTRFWDNVMNVKGAIIDLAMAIPFLITYDQLNLLPIESTGMVKIPQNKPLTIELEDVSFQYPNTENAVLKGVNLTIQQGDQLALIGLNGAGKSTLIKLLTGLYHPTNGRILINGIDLRKANIEHYRKMMSYMDQHVPLYDDKIRHQIHYGQLESPLDQNRLDKALHTSGFNEILQELPRGLDTHAGRQYALKEDHPIELSGGQNQLLAIARTLYRDAKLYIFDEPTSAVDAMKEEQFFNRLPEALEGKTVLFISHRFSTVRRAKRIIVLSGGSIVEDGTHDELMKKEGLYHELFTLQAKAYT